MHVQNVCYDMINVLTETFNAATNLQPIAAHPHASSLKIACIIAKKSTHYLPLRSTQGRMLTWGFSRRGFPAT